MEKVSKSFRILPEVNLMLKELSQRLNLSENQVVNQAIQYFYQEQLNRKTEKLLEEKDRLIAKLTKQLLEKPKKRKKKTK